MFTVTIALYPNQNVTGSLGEAMGSSGFVQSQVSDLVYFIISDDSIDVVEEVAMRTLRNIGLDNARVRVMQA